MSNKFVGYALRFKTHEIVFIPYMWQEADNFTYLQMCILIWTAYQSESLNMSVFLVYFLLSWMVSDSRV